MRWRRANGGNGDGAETTVFFATDLHGSELCFQKFVAAARFYGADVLILGGDMTGKFVVPIIERQDGTFEAELRGERRVVPQRDVEKLEKEIANTGLYSKRMSPQEARRYGEDPEELDALFEQLMVDRLIHWMSYAKEKLEGTDIRILCAPGNDDPFVVDEVIREHGGDRVLLLEGEIFELAPGHQMLSTGYSNPTPWHTPRELSEEEIRRKIDRMAEHLEDSSTAIFNIHVPPFDSGLDVAPALDEDLAVKTSAGAQLTAPVGSTAVREALEEYQPLISLHGHIHEAAGSTKIGRTVALNAGSEYPDGVLRGMLITIGGGKLIRYQATAG